jgi:hypothetical protein
MDYAGDGDIAEKNIDQARARDEGEYRWGDEQSAPPLRPLAIKRETHAPTWIGSLSGSVIQGGRWEVKLGPKVRWRGRH